MGFKPGVSLRFPAQGQFHSSSTSPGSSARDREARREGLHRHARREDRAGAAGEGPRQGRAVVTARRSSSRPTRRSTTWSRCTPSRRLPHLRHRGRVPQGSITKALYWDTVDPYHYVRLEPMDGGRRPPHRRRRGPQDRPGRRRRRALRPAGDVGPRAVPERWGRSNTAGRAR